MDGDVQLRVGLDSSAAESGAARIRSAMNGLSREAENATSRAVNKVGSMLKRALIFRYLSKGFAQLSNWFKSLLMNDSQVVASLNQIKGAFMTAFTPIYNAVLPAIKALLSVLAQFVSAMAAVINSLFGIRPEKAQANAKALNSQANATKKAGKAADKAVKSLAKFDEINQLNGSSGSSSSGADTSVDLSANAVDYSGISKVSELMKEIFKIAVAVGAAIALWNFLLKFEKFSAAFDTFGKKLGFIVGIAATIYGAFQLIEGVIDAWKNGIDTINSSKMLGGSAAIVGGLWLAFKKVGAAVGAIVSGITMVVTGIKDIIDNGPNLQNICVIIEGIALVVLGIGLLIGGIPGLIMVIVAAVAAVGAYVVSHWEEIKALLSKAWEWIKTTAATVWEWIKAQLSAFANWIDTSVIKPIVGFFTRLWEDIKAIWAAAPQWFEDTIWAPIKAFAGNLWDGIKTVASNCWDGIKEIWSSVARWFEDTVWTPIRDNPVLSAIADAISNVFSTAVDTIKSVGEGLKEWFSALWQLLSGDISLEEAGTKMLTIFANAWNGIKGLFSGVFDVFKDIGANVLNGLTNGIEGLWESTKTKVVGFFSNIWDGVKSFFGIHSPSTLAAEAGGNVMEGFGNGADDKKASIGEKLKGVFEGIWSVAKSAWDGVSGWLKKLFGWDDGADGAADSAKTNAANAAEDVVSGVNGAFEGSNVAQPVTDSANAAIEALQGLEGKATQVATNTQNAFKTAWDNVIKTFEAKGANFKALVDGIKGVLKKLLNSMISGLNNVMSNTFGQVNNRISALKNLDIGGFRPFSRMSSISIPKIPALAKGAVIPANHEFLAVLGDQKSGTNIEAPLDTIVEAMQMALATTGNNADSIARAVKSGLSGLALKIDKRTAGYIIADAINENRRAEGKLALRL